MEFIICKRCGKKLKNKNSLKIGYGPVCEQKVLNEYYNQNQIKIEDLLMKEGADNEK